MWNLRTKSAGGEEVFKPHTKKNLTSGAKCRKQAVADEDNLPESQEKEK